MEIETIRNQITNLHRSIEDERERLMGKDIIWDSLNTKYSRSGSGWEPSPKFALGKTFKQDRFNNTRFVSWGKDFQLLTATSHIKGQGGVIVYDAKEGKPEYFLPIRSKDAMRHLFLDAKLEQSKGKLTVLSNLTEGVKIYKFAKKAKEGSRLKEIDFLRTLETSGAGNAVNFQDDCHLMVATAESPLNYFDLNGGFRASAQLHGHTADAFSVTNYKANGGRDGTNLFLSGGGDFTARLWDVRNNEQIGRYDTGSRDVNSVSFFPDGKSFSCALSNSEIHMYDIRMTSKLLTFINPSCFERYSAEQVEFSRSGRMLFARYGRERVVCFDLFDSGRDKTPSRGTFNRKVAYDFYEKSNVECESFAIQREGKCIALADKSRERVLMTKLFWPDN
eukprot:maker-scaffold_3-snap-gene-13.45-mRNA-1 protein AED:0.03 eAED:0.03 QI:78/1/1/1/0.5/0.33/3/336/391